jgi:hypothetical protein
MRRPPARGASLAGVIDRTTATEAARRATFRALARRAGRPRGPRTTPPRSDSVGAYTCPFSAQVRSISSLAGSFWTTSK